MQLSSKKTARDLRVVNEVFAKGSPVQLIFTDVLVMAVTVGMTAVRAGKEFETDGGRGVGGR